MSRELGPINIGKRLVLAGIVLGGTACGTASGKECPTSAAEVSYLVGGNPQKWHPISDIEGSWKFGSDQPEVVNGTYSGRVDVPQIGQIHPRNSISSPDRVETTEAWYVCVVPKTSVPPQNPS